MHCGISKAVGSVGEICRGRKKRPQCSVTSARAWVVLSAVSGTHVGHVVHSVACHISEGLSDTAHMPSVYFAWYIDWY